MNDFLTRADLLTEEFNFPVTVEASPELVAACRRHPEADAPFLIGTKTAADEHVANLSGPVRSLSRTEAQEALGDRYEIGPGYGRSARQLPDRARDFKLDFERQ